MYAVPNNIPPKSLYKLVKRSARKNVGNEALESGARERFSIYISEVIFRSDIVYNIVDVMPFSDEVVVDSDVFRALSSLLSVNKRLD
jgi:hypothetical protein